MTIIAIDIIQIILTISKIGIHLRSTILLELAIIIQGIEIYQRADLIPIVGINVQLDSIPPHTNIISMIQREMITMNKLERDLATTIFMKINDRTDSTIVTATLVEKEVPLPIAICAGIQCK